MWCADDCRSFVYAILQNTSNPKVNNLESTIFMHHYICSYFAHHELVHNLLTLFTIFATTETQIRTFYVSMNDTSIVYSFQSYRKFSGDGNNIFFFKPISGSSHL